MAGVCSSCGFEVSDKFKFCPICGSKITSDNEPPHEKYNKLNYIIEYELIPLLKEYWFDEPEKVNNWSARLRSVLDDS